MRVTTDFHPFEEDRGYRMARWVCLILIVVFVAICAWRLSDVQQAVSLGKTARVDSRFDCTGKPAVASREFVIDFGIASQPAGRK